MDKNLRKTKIESQFKDRNSLKDTRKKQHAWLVRQRERKWNNEREREIYECQWQMN